MNRDPFRCTHCGATFSLDDLRGQNCPYCGNVLPHQARAAEHAVLVNQVLNDQLRMRGYGAMQGPFVPHQYGMTPPPMQYPVPDVAQAVRRSMLVVVIVSVAIGLLVLSAVVVMLFLLL